MVDETFYPVEDGWEGKEPLPRENASLAIIIELADHAGAEDPREAMQHVVKLVESLEDVERVRFVKLYEDGLNLYSDDPDPQMASEFKIDW